MRRGTDPGWGLSTLSGGAHQWLVSVLEENLSQGEHIALVCGDSTMPLKASDFWRQSSVFLSRFSELGLEPNDVVAVAHDKSPAAYSIQLACIRAGLPYVAVDYSQPELRLQQQLKSVSARFLFLPDSLSADNFNHLDIGLEVFSMGSTVKSNPAFELLTLIPDHNVAYLIFTSGSTGTPKPVSISWRNVKVFLEWITSELSLSSDDVFSGLNPAYFDNAIFDFYVSQFCGGKLVSVKESALADSTSVMRTLVDNGCSVWFSVPSLLVLALVKRALSPEALSGFRLIIFGGEAFPMVHLRKLSSLTSPTTRLVNVYGPSECTCICSVRFLAEEDISPSEPWPLIATPPPHFSWSLENRDSDGIGELVLRGEQVGLGYFGYPNSDNSPFLGEPGQPSREYKTGDLFLLTESGRLRFVGRFDSQVKIMGRRVELGEIERIAASIDGVEEVCATRIELESGAFVVGLAYRSSTNMSEQRIAEALSEQLPRYMRPRLFRKISELPRNRNGKVSRRAVGELLSEVS